ncbi:hypothetical protein BD311DRAFT_795777 [Dichomitus squalens]|uniref:F-box domain-containing protein n=1 Tax=Dichomitus squalens TaxID=114155 RepID=A0A4Q9MXL4_9APHY|nr:hypothetical protein BD311DRAFT_795777 [Dichomitus squalens]
MCAFYSWSPTISSTMHTLPVVDDVLAQIFSHLDPSRSTSPEEDELLRATLASSARSSKGLTVHAIKFLWRRLPSERPLTNLLSTLGLVQCEPDECKLLILTQRQEPHAHLSWRRFLDYASHVREVTLHPLETPAASTLWRDMWQSPRNQDSFHLISPHVRELSFLITSKGRRLVPGSDHLMDSLLSDTCAACPQLQTLRIRYTRFSSEVLKSCLPHVRRLEIAGAKMQKEFDAFANLPALQHLSLSLDGPWGRPLVFPTLQSLAVMGDSVSISTLLKHAIMPQLRSISLSALWITLDLPFANEIARQHTGPLASNCPALTSVSMHFRPMGFRVGHDPIPIYFPISGEALTEIIEPLLTLRDLCSLSLIMEKIDLDHSSSLFLDMARSWPYLEELHIELNEVKVARADVYSIDHFAEHCPRLRRLRMPALDVTPEGLARLEDFAAPEQHALQYFAVPTVMVRGHEALALQIKIAIGKGYGSYTHAPRNFSSAVGTCVIYLETSSAEPTASNLNKLSSSPSHRSSTLSCQFGAQPWYAMDDIIYQVFEQLHVSVDINFAQDEVRDAIHCRQALARLARSCRAFTHPALKVLWRCLPSDQPLLELLCTLAIAHYSLDASTAYNYLVDPEYQAIYVPRLSVQQDVRAHPQWERFSQHASYVRKINLDPFQSPARSAIWKDIASLIGDIHVLPQLHTVYVGEQVFPRRSRALSSDNLGCLSLIHPSVREVQLRYSQWDHADTRKRVMAQIVTAAPNLESFHSRYSPAGLGHPGLLTHFPHLRDITIDTKIHSGDLQDLARLPVLRDLSIVVTSLCSCGIVSPSLTHRCVERPWKSNGGPFESALAPQLRSLSIHTLLENTLLVADASRLLHRISAAHTMLEKLSLYVHLSWTGDPAPSPNAPVGAARLAAIAEPLLSLRALRSVSLRFEGYDLEYASQDVQAFSAAWPRLEELDLDFRVIQGPRAGMDALAHFARNCPRLRGLRLPGVDVVENTLAAADAVATPHATLCELVIPHVVFQGTDEERLSAEMWAYIARQFPRAVERSKIDTGNDGDGLSGFGPAL